VTVECLFIFLQTCTVAGQSKLVGQASHPLSLASFRSTIGRDGLAVLDANAKTERGERSKQQSMRTSLRDDEDQVGPASPSQTVVSCSLAGLQLASLIFLRASTKSSMKHASMASLLLVWPANMGLGIWDREIW
jgi:hypothetical protein